MLFRNEESSLRLDIVNYEFPPDGGDPTSDDRNWLVLRATWNKEDGDVVKDSNSCLLTHELQSMSAGLKVLKAGIRDVYVTCTMDQKEMEALIGELDRLCEKFPDRT